MQVLVGFVSRLKGFTAQLVRAWRLGGLLAGPSSAAPRLSGFTAQQGSVRGSWGGLMSRPSSASPRLGGFSGARLFPGGGRGEGRRNKAVSSLRSEGKNIWRSDKLTANISWRQVAGLHAAESLTDLEDPIGLWLDRHTQVNTSNHTELT